MWMGTPAGLYRYDGYIFKHFQTDSQDGSSLPDSYIESIQEAFDGKLWVKTPAGYCIYHPNSESFERDMRQVFARLGMKDVPDIIYIDRLKNLWGYIPGRGVIAYNMQQQLFYDFSMAEGAQAFASSRFLLLSSCAVVAIPRMKAILAGLPFSERSSRNRSSFSSFNKADISDAGVSIRASSSICSSCSCE
jgi:hypothetical protein